MPSWRNWISRLTSNQKIVGSSPTGGNKNYFHCNRINMCYLDNFFKLLQTIFSYFYYKKRDNDCTDNVYYNFT